MFALKTFKSKIFTLTLNEMATWKLIIKLQNAEINTNRLNYLICENDIRPSVYVDQIVMYS